MGQAGKAISYQPPSRTRPGKDIDESAPGSVFIRVTAPPSKVEGEGSEAA